MQRNLLWCGLVRKNSVTKWVSERDSKRARIRGKIKRQKAASKKTRPCKRCVSAGKYDRSKHHSNARSKLCFFYKPNKATILKEPFGSTVSYCVVKSGLENSLRLPDSDQDIFCENLTQVVEAVREVTMKSHLFATHLILHWMETKKEMTAAFFTQNYFFKAMQLVCQNINTDDEDSHGSMEIDERSGAVEDDQDDGTQLPVEKMEKGFKSYRELHPNIVV